MYLPFFLSICVILYIFQIYIIRCIIIHDFIPSYGLYYYKNKIFLYFYALVHCSIYSIINITQFFWFVNKILKLLYPSVKTILLFHFIYFCLSDIFRSISFQYGIFCLSNADFYPFATCTGKSYIFGFLPN